MKSTIQVASERVKVLNNLIEIPLQVINNLSDLLDEGYIDVKAFCAAVDNMQDIQKHIVADITKLS
jgi:hypothetical protein